MDSSILPEFEKKAQARVPDFKVAFKDESRLMKVLGALLALFNPGFMTAFATTIGSTVYFPSRKNYGADPAQQFALLAHEYVHVVDNKKHWGFRLSYVFPQALALIPLIIFGVMAWPHLWLLLVPVLGLPFAKLGKGVLRLALAWLGAATFLLALYFTGWATLPLALFALLLAPWPAPWRSKWEFRGYAMSMAVAYWLTGTFRPTQLEILEEYFVGPDYYFMCWRRLPVRQRLEKELGRVQTLAVLEDPAFKDVYDFLRERRLLRQK